MCVCLALDVDLLCFACFFLGIVVTRYVCSEIIYKLLIECGDNLKSLTFN